MGNVKLLILESVDLVATRRSSVLSLLSFRKFKVNQSLISSKQLVRDKGGSEEVGLLDI